MSTFYRRHHKGIIITVFVLLAVFILLYILAPYLTKLYLNERVLNDLGEYQGHVDYVALRPIRGGGTLQELRIWRKDGDSDEPMVLIKESQVDLIWADLFRRRLGAKISLHDPEINIIAVEPDPDVEPPDWDEIIAAYEGLFPFILHQFHVVNGQIKFQNFDTEPNIHVSASNIEILLTNLTNIRDIKGDRRASLHLSGTLLEEGSIAARAHIDPYEVNDFEFASEITDIQLPELNDIARAYANLDFASGHGEILVEVKGSEGELSGYIKPLFEDIEILNWEQDVEEQEKGPISLAWEGIANLGKSILLSPTTEKVATEIEVEGTLDDLEIDTWGTVAGFFRNAFVESLSAEFEGTTELTEDDPGQGEVQLNDEDEDEERVEVPLP